MYDKESKNTNVGKIFERILRKLQINFAKVSNEFCEFRENGLKLSFSFTFSLDEQNFSEKD